MQDTDVTVAGITEAQLKALDAHFPNRCPDIRWTDREVWFEAGKRAVVDFLHEQHLRENEVVLKD